MEEELEWPRVAGELLHADCSCTPPKLAELPRSLKRDIYKGKICSGEQAIAKTRCQDFIFLSDSLQRYIMYIVTLLILSIWICHQLFCTIALQVEMNIWKHEIFEIYFQLYIYLCAVENHVCKINIYTNMKWKRGIENKNRYIYICVLIIETCCFVKIFGLYRLWGIASQFSSQCSISVCKRIPSIYMFHDRGWYIYTLFHCCVSQIHKHRQNQKTSTTTVWPESVSTAPSGGSYYPGWKIEWLGLHPLHPMRRKPMYRMSPKGIEVFTHKTRI